MPLSNQPTTTSPVELLPHANGRVGGSGVSHYILHGALAARLIMHGFGRVCYLDGLTPADVEELGHSGWDKAIMLRALKKTQVASLRQRMTWAGSVLAPPDAPAPVRSRVRTYRRAPQGIGDLGGYLVENRGHGSSLLAHWTYEVGRAAHEGQAKRSGRQRPPRSAGTVVAARLWSHLPSLPSAPGFGAGTSSLVECWGTWQRERYHPSGAWTSRGSWPESGEDGQRRRLPRSQGLQSP